MTTNCMCRSQDDHAASGIELRLRHSVRLGIWKRFLWRFIPTTLGLVIIGSVLLEAVMRMLPTGGALLYDVGKIGVPDGILLKPGKLSTEERREIERHVVYGDEIL